MTPMSQKHGLLTHSCGHALLALPSVASLSASVAPIAAAVCQRTAPDYEIRPQQSMLTTGMYYATDLSLHHAWAVIPAECKLMMKALTLCRPTSPLQQHAHPSLLQHVSRAAGSCTIDSQPHIHPSVQQCPRWCNACGTPAAPSALCMSAPPSSQT